MGYVQYAPSVLCCTVLYYTALYSVLRSTPNAKASLASSGPGWSEGPLPSFIVNYLLPYDFRPSPSVRALRVTQQRQQQYRAPFCPLLPLRIAAKLSAVLHILLAA